MRNKFSLRQFVLISLVVSIWIHVSEATRFFGVVAPQIRDYLSSIPDLIPLSLPVVLVWGAWDMLLTFCAVFMCWLVLRAFGDSFRSTLLAGTISCAFFFGLFWVAMVLMGLSPLPLALMAIAMAWVEMVIASYLAAWLYRRGFPAGK